MRRHPLIPLMVTVGTLLGPGLFADEPAPSRAVVDLATRDGVELVSGRWRYHDARLIEVDFRAAGADPPNRTFDVDPRAGDASFDDSGWAIIDPETLDARRAAGKVCFNWYRIRVTIPDRIGAFDPRGATVAFEITVDDYAEVWVDGALPRELGQRGGSVVAGWNAPNRVVLTRDAQPGQSFQIAVFGINGPISDAPANYIWVRAAQLHFEAPRPTGPAVERLDPRLDALVAPGAALEAVASGFAWLEGPVWSAVDRCLYFSDIPANAVYRWSETRGAELYLTPSGYTGREAFTGREPGSNGLALDPEGRLVLCAHGDRCIVRIERDGTRRVLVDRYRGSRLNSPNDVLFSTNGDMYFSDPPFGLPGTFDDPARELSFAGVYRLQSDGELELLVDDLPGPNGIALSPDERTLYVSNAVRGAQAWYAYDLTSGAARDGRLLLDAAPWTGSRPGTPDGMAIDQHGNLLTAGPGGVYVIAPDGAHLGTILTGTATSNCAWGDDGRTLFVTAGSTLYRMRTLTRGW